MNGLLKAKKIRVTTYLADEFGWATDFRVAYGEGAPEDLRDLFRVARSRARWYRHRSGEKSAKLEVVVEAVCNGFSRFSYAAV